MARVKGDRVVLDGGGPEPISAWAILVHGHTQPDLLFSTQAGAEIYRSYTRHLAGCEIVPVVVSDNVVSRIG